MNDLCKKNLLVIFLTVFTLLGVQANNLILSNGERLDASGAKDEITFSIAWENSWNVVGAPANHDAVWVFIKYRECSTFGVWNHAKLVTTSGVAGTSSASGHTLGADIAFATDIKTTDRRGLATHGEHNTGVMIRRGTVGVGDITAQVCTLKVLPNAVNGTLLDPTKEYDIKVFGIEMVQVPEGAYYVGDGTSTNRYFDPSSNALPFHINAGEETSYNWRANNEGSDKIWPDSVAVGYQEFYSMKYEITQGQYVDFLNTISPVQQSTRYTGRTFNGVNFTMTSLVAATLYPNRANTYGSTNDYISYLDWACLRPTSELEFEKICRGPGYPLADESVIGEIFNTNLVDAETVTYPAEGQMQATEVGANINSADGTAVTNYPGPNTTGPMEVGIFAREGGETRRSSGAAYYGAMEMAGNAMELCISMYYKRDLWIGDWGNGQLDAAGEFDVASWLAIVPGNYDLIRKGGYYNDNHLNSNERHSFKISDRGGATTFIYRVNIGTSDGTGSSLRGVR